QAPGELRLGGEPPAAEERRTEAAEHERSQPRVPAGEMVDRVAVQVVDREAEEVCLPIRGPEPERGVLPGPEDLGAPPLAEGVTRLHAQREPPGDVELIQFRRLPVEARVRSVAGQEGCLPGLRPGRARGGEREGDGGEAGGREPHGITSLEPRITM